MVDKLHPLITVYLLSVPLIIIQGNYLIDPIITLTESLSNDSEQFKRNSDIIRYEKK